MRGRESCGGYKFFWMGREKGYHGVGVLVAEEWIEKVLDVKRWSQRIMVLRVVVGRSVVNLVSVYAPQTGRGKEEKEEFFLVLGKVLSDIDVGEGLLICGDMNGHVGAGVDGFEGVYGGYGFGRRSVDGEMLLAFDMVPREVVWWALRCLGVDEWIVSVIKAMYEDATTTVRVNGRESKAFSVRVGVHQGSVLSPLLFIIVLEALSREFREGLPMELLYADDLVLVAETEELLMEKLRN